MTLSPTRRLENRCFSNKGGVLFVARNHTLHAIAKAQQDVSKINTQAFANKIPRENENTVLFVDTKMSVLLQTAKIFVSRANEPNRHIQARLIFDTVSQCSYVTT